MWTKGKGPNHVSLRPSDAIVLFDGRLLCIHAP